MTTEGQARRCVPLPSTSACVAFGVLFAALDACDCGGGDLADGKLEVQPDILDLGSVIVGIARRGTLLLENTGASPLGIIESKPSDNLAGEVRLDAVPAVVPSGGQREVAVVLVPSSRGTREGDIVFSTDSLRTPEVRVRVVAVAIDPRLMSIPAVLDFGRVVIGTSATATVTIANSGDTPVTIRTVTTDVDTTPEFSTRLRAIRRLDPGESFEVEVMYTPADVGFDEGRTITGDDTPLPSKAAFALRGEGVTSEIEIDPAEIDFSGVFVGERRTRFFDLKNLGALTHTISLITLTGTSSGEFSIESSTTAVTPFDLAPGDERRIDVSYAPVDTGSDSNRIRVESTGLTAAAFVALTGEAESAPAPEIDVAPPRIVFGNVQLGSRVPQALRIDNRGSADLHLIGDVEIDPPFSDYVLVGAPSADAILAPLDSHTLAVEFAPGSLGASPAARVVIRSNDPDEGLITIPLEGSGQQDAIADLEVTPARVDFGQVPRGISAGRSVNLRNAGTAPLDIVEVTATDTRGGRYTIAVLPDLPLTLAPLAAVQFELGYEDRVGLVASYAGNVRILSSDGDESPFDVLLGAETVAPPIGPPDLAVALTWDTLESDLDLHVIRPGGAYFDRPSDCCSCNANPDWGRVGQGSDNPFLDRDDIDGLGPETIQLEHADPGDYLVIVHDASDRGPGPTTALLTVRSGRDVIGTFSRVLANDQRWTAGTFTWNGTSGTFFPGTVPVTASLRSTCF